MLRTLCVLSFCVLCAMCSSLAVCGTTRTWRGVLVLCSRAVCVCVYDMAWQRGFGWADLLDAKREHHSGSEVGSGPGDARGGPLPHLHVRATPRTTPLHLSPVAPLFPLRVFLTPSSLLLPCPWAHTRLCCHTPFPRLLWSSMHAAVCVCALFQTFFVSIALLVG